MDPTGIIIILVSLGALLFFGLRLYSALGRREGHMEPPPRAANPTLPGEADEAEAAGPAFQGPAAEGLHDIARADRHFHPVDFLEGAQSAYRMIVGAYADGDKDALKSLLAGKVYDAYVNSIDARRAKGETLKTEIERIASAEFSCAELDGDIARIRVDFTTDIATETRSAEGEVISGDLNQLNTVREIWTFERNVAASDPNWVLTRVAAG